MNFGAIMDYDYLITARELKHNKFNPTVGPIQYIRVARDKPEYTGTHVVNGKDWIRAVQGLADGDQNPNSISPRGDVLVFVHGYNNTIGNVLERTRCLRANLLKEGGAARSYPLIGRATTRRLPTWKTDPTPLRWRPSSSLTASAYWS